ncbi:MAG: Crp/Fnr family transcriptional regulator [Desulfovibrio sp.]|nr:Crp/Fnr family transcriptional regulator [Desulfovibrio sp.]
MPIPESPLSSESEELFVLPPFDMLELDEREHLVKKIRLHNFAADDILYAQGQENVPLFFLCSGLIKLSCTASQGRECVLHLIRPKSFVDAAVLFYEGGMPYSAIAINNGMLYALEKNVVLGLMHGNAAFSLRMMKLMAARQRLFINKLVGSQGRISVTCRVSSWLLHRSRMEGTNILYIDISRELMARLLGVTRESMSRELSRLAELGYIAVARRQITLLEKKALQKLANM